jgi:hypothetical protein
MKLHVGRRTISLTIEHARLPGLDPMPEATDRELAGLGRGAAIDIETVRWQGLSYLYGRPHPLIDGSSR